MIPDYIKEGATVFIADAFFEGEAVIASVFDYASSWTRITYEGRDDQSATQLWANTGDHCTGPHVFPDKAAYDAAVSAQQRALKALAIFAELSPEKQAEAIAMLERARGDEETAP